MRLSVRGDCRGDSKALIIQVEGVTISLCPAVTLMRELLLASRLAGRAQQFVWYHSCVMGETDKKLLYHSGCSWQCLSSAKPYLVPGEAARCACFFRMQVLRQNHRRVAYSWPHEESLLYKQSGLGRRHFFMMIISSSCSLILCCLVWFFLSDWYFRWWQCYD